MHVNIQFISMCNTHTHINKFSSIGIAIIIYNLVNTHAMYLQYHQIMRSIALWASLRSFGLSKAQCKTYNASRNSCLRLDVLIGFQTWEDFSTKKSCVDGCFGNVLETSDVKAGLVLICLFF